MVKLCKIALSKYVVPRKNIRAFALTSSVLLGLACSDTLETKIDSQSTNSDKNIENSGPQNQPPTGQIDSKAPTNTKLVTGNNQTAIVGSAVAIPPAMQVTDAQGSPVKGIEITFSVLKGEGQVSGEKAITNENGIAEVGSWVLGPAVGTNELRGEFPGLAPVYFVAESLPDARGSFKIDRGNYQYSAVNTTLAIQPRVRFTDQNNMPFSNKTVRFSAAVGSGTVNPTQVTTDVDGYASTSWTLGPAPGQQTLSASTDNLPSLNFSANALSLLEPGLTVETVVENLNFPWDMAFLPNGDIVFTEKSGFIGRIASGTGSVTPLATRPADLNDSDQSGLLGIAVDPNYNTTRKIFTFLSAIQSGNTVNRIRAWTIAENNMSALATGDIFTGLHWGANGAHSGGRIRFGMDGYLYITTGDTRSATVPQNIGVLGGKIVRITSTGGAAPGNPDFGPTGRVGLYSIGYRNPQGLAFRSFGGVQQAFTCEHGPSGFDEVTRIVPKGNGGWNPNDGAGNYNGYTGAQMTNSSLPDVVLPSFTTGSITNLGMSGCTFVNGTQWKNWDGSLFVGFLAAQDVWVVPLTPDGGTSSVSPQTARKILTGLGRIRSLVQGPDGFLYIVTNTTNGPGGKILRVRPQ